MGVEGNFVFNNKAKCFKNNKVIMRKVVSVIKDTVPKKQLKSAFKNPQYHDKVIKTPSFSPHIIPYGEIIPYMV